MRGRPAPGIGPFPHYSTRFRSDTQGSKAWVSSLVGGTGSVTVTSLDAGGAKGSFSFTAQPGTTTGATGTRSVTEGSFGVKF